MKEECFTPPKQPPTKATSSVIQKVGEIGFLEATESGVELHGV